MGTPLFFATYRNFSVGCEYYVYSVRKKLLGGDKVAVKE